MLQIALRIVLTLGLQVPQRKEPGNCAELSTSICPPSGKRQALYQAWGCSAGAVLAAHPSTAFRTGWRSPGCLWSRGSLVKSCIGRADRGPFTRYKRFLCVESLPWMCALLAVIWSETARLFWAGLNGSLSYAPLATVWKKLGIWSDWDLVLALGAAMMNRAIRDNPGALVF